MSFANEIKDFLAAAQAGQKIMGASDDAEYKRLRLEAARAKHKFDTDPETIKANKDILRGRANKALLGDQNAGVRAATIRSHDAATRERDARTEAWKRQNGPAVGGANPDALEFARPPGPQSDAAPAIGGIAPVASLDEEDEGAAVAPAEFAANGGLVGFSMTSMHDAVRDGLTHLAHARGHGGPQAAVPTQSASRGGKIQHMADGGLVDEEDDEPADELAETPMPADEPDEEDEGADGGALPINAAPTAGVRQPSMYPRTRSAAPQPGVLTQTDMTAIYQAVDPKKELGESHRNMKALTAVYEFYLKKGDPARAQAAAASILQNYKRASQQYGAFANAALEKGEFDDAARLAMKAYAGIPDGRDIKIKHDNGKFSYEITDEATGKVTTKGVASPRELAAMAMRVGANGFDEFILDAAGQRAAAKGKGAVGGDKPLPARERAASADLVSGAMEAAKVDPAMKDDVQTIASQITAHNNVQGRDAIRIAGEIFNVADPDKPGAKINVDKTTGGGTITTAAGDTVRVPKETIAHIGGLQQARIAARRQAQEKEATDKKASEQRDVERQGALDTYRAEAPARRTASSQTAKTWRDGDNSPMSSRRSKETSPYRGE